MNNSAVKTIPQILKDNICTVFNLLNILIAISLAAVGAWKNILFIMVILVNTTVGIIQEIKAKCRIEKLTVLSLPKFRVTRGKEYEILPDDIKKDDITDINEDEFNRLISAYIIHSDDNNSTYTAFKNHFKCVDTYGCISGTPFSSERKFSSVTLDNGQTFVIGAPEKLCKSVPEAALGLMAEGKRVIYAGICNGEVVPENVDIVGMIVISDTVKKTHGIQ